MKLSALIDAMPDDPRVAVVKLIDALDNYARSIEASEDEADTNSWFTGPMSAEQRMSGRVEIAKAKAWLRELRQQGTCLFDKKGNIIG